MLAEIRCDKFRKGPVVFQPSLNVVLGDDNATNSIGKSTLLMIIDFALGGTSLLTHNTDVVRELGHHDYFFTFEFDGESYRFRRGTYEPTVIYACNDQFEAVRTIEVEDYTALLKQFYGVDLPDLSFRSLVGLYIRVWGKDNLSVARPLHVVQTQTARDCVDTLIKIFRMYESIRSLSSDLSAAEAKATALNAATRHAIVRTVGKRDYASNQKRINALEAELSEIRNNLARYATNLSAIVNQEVLDLKIEKDQLLDLRLEVSGRLQRIQKNLTETRNVRSASFRDLTRFFPQIDEGRLTRVEEFHSDVAKLLRTELKESESQLMNQLSRIDDSIRGLDESMARTLQSVEEPGHLVDHVLDVALNLQQTKEINEQFERDSSLRENVKVLRADLAQEKTKVVKLLESIINDGMRRIVNSVFDEDTKSPRLSLRENSYSFEVYDDTGTGTAYASLVIFDLTVFLATSLPVVAHDTLLFKNIANRSVAGLLQIYMQTTKQSFIALDEIEKYGKETTAVLRARSVLQLDNENVLYTKDWRIKTA